MLTYFRMKKNQWKTKAFLYGITARILDEHQDMITLVSDIYTALKDIPAEECKKSRSPSQPSALAQGSSPV